MFYCDTCMLLSEGEECPVCGKPELKNPEPDDLCFLAEKEMIWSGMLADVLEQKNIPFAQKPILGAGMAMTVGLSLERYRFYVPFSRFADAQEIVNELFGETGAE